MHWIDARHDYTNAIGSRLLPALQQYLEKESTRAPDSAPPVADAENPLHAETADATQEAPPLEREAETAASACAENAPSQSARSASHSPRHAAATGKSVESPPKSVASSSRRR